MVLSLIFTGHVCKYKPSGNNFLVVKLLTAWYFSLCLESGLDVRGEEGRGSPMPKKGTWAPGPGPPSRQKRPRKRDLGPRTSVSSSSCSVGRRFEKSRCMCSSNLLCPALPPNNLSQGNWPRTISPIRGAMHLNAEILL